MIKQRLCEIEQELEDRDALKSHPVSDSHQPYANELILTESS